MSCDLGWPLSVVCHFLCDGQYSVLFVVTGLFLLNSFAIGDCEPRIWWFCWVFVEWAAWRGSLILCDMMKLKKWKRTSLSLSLSLSCSE